MRTHRHSDFENNEYSIIRNIILNSDPTKYNHAAGKHYVDQALSNAIDEVTVVRTHPHSDFENNELSNIRSILLNSDPIEYNHAARRKHYVDNTIDESSLLRLDPDEKLKLDEQDSINLSSPETSPKAIIELTTKSYVDSSHENNRNRRDLSSVFNDQ